MNRRFFFRALAGLAASLGFAPKAKAAIPAGRVLWFQAKSCWEIAANGSTVHRTVTEFGATTLETLQYTLDWVIADEPKRAGFERNVCLTFDPFQKECWVEIIDVEKAAA